MDGRWRRTSPVAKSAATAVCCWCGKWIGNSDCCVACRGISSVNGRTGKVLHTAETMLRQRVMGLIAGWEDLNDAQTLRTDPVHQVAAGSLEPLASAPTLCRYENQQARATAWAVNGELGEQFIASRPKAPAVLILDFDATDTPVHGQQEQRFFHGYYDCHCFLPLYVFCGDQLLTAYLRPSNIDPAKHAAAILKLLVTRLRQAWPRTKIVFRADSGFCRDWLRDHQHRRRCAEILRPTLLSAR